MRSIFLGSLSAVALLGLSACGNPAEEPAEEGVTETAAPAETEAPEPVVDYSDLNTVLAGDWRGEAAERDAWRHPAETLEFFGVDPSSTIVEIWPGGGWYADVLAPWIAANDGTYVAAHFPADSSSDYRRRSRANFEARVSDVPAYGEPEIVDFNSEVGLVVEAGSEDAVQTFRNIHNRMAGGVAEPAFAEFYTALRPGGILGVVEHRMPSTRQQDPMARSGYVQQDYVIAMAEEAGFEFVEASEVNANPADTADHPYGVWTLPPTRRSPAEDEEGFEDFDRAQYDAIGESDRMTLLFRKPDAE